MLKLHVKTESLPSTEPISGLHIVTKNAHCPSTLRAGRVYISDFPITETGFGAYLVPEKHWNLVTENNSEKKLNVFKFHNNLSYLEEGDIIRMSQQDSSVSCLYRKNSNHNTILLTERCNHYCLMCSQPPKNIDDSALLDEALKLIEIIPTETSNLGFSGGEPTLYGDDFIRLINKTKSYLPQTAIDVLTNGRAFNNKSFAKKYSEIDHPNCMLGIPIYSDDPVRHDYVVQSKGAFDQTVRGILNLKSFNQRVEIRIVIHKQTIERLVKTCEFIGRNLLFVDHVALMGLEMMGFTRANLKDLWVDPYDYKDILSDAVSVLNSYGLTNSVYNHQICVVNQDITNSYVKSISDWKNEYLDICASCSKKGECGGFFSSSKMYRHSDHITPYL